MTLHSIPHRGLVFGVVLFVGSAAACDRAADDEQKVNVARTEADQKIAAATAEAAQKIAAAEASLAKLREDYRHTTTTNLADLDRDVAGIEVKAKQSSGKAKADLDARLARIHAGREAFVRDYDSLAAATGVTWDDTKARLDKEWLDLKALVDNV